MFEIPLESLPTAMKDMKRYAHCSKEHLVNKKQFLSIVEIPEFWKEPNTDFSI